MNLKKFTSIAILSIPAFVLAQDAKNEDRSYLADFAKEKAFLSFKDTEKNEKTDYVLMGIEKIAGRESFVLGLVGNEKQQLIVNENTKDMSFIYISPEDTAIKFNDFLMAGKRDEAIQIVRKDIYSLFPLIKASETLFPVQENILEYLELLLISERTKEFYSIFKTLDFSKLRDEYVDLSLDFAKILAENAEFEQCLEVLEILNVETNRKDLIPELMNILTIFREANRIADIARYYTRLQAIPDNDLALEARMWSLYCDIHKDEVIAAGVMLKHFGKVDKKIPEYSLYKMIAGLIAKENKQNVAALEHFSEGIVYGKSVDDWMPELMYNTALSYSKTDKMEIAMQILEEMRKFYPENIFLAKAENDIK